MEWEQRNIRFCAGILVFSALLRLWIMGAFAPVGQALQSSDAASFFIYLQTGRVIRRIPEPSSAPVPETVPLKPAEPVVFRAEDGALVALEDTCGKKPDVEKWLTEPVDLSLNGPEPRVLILHTHTTESFAQTADRYEETSPYRTLDPGHNMLFLGDLLARMLEEAGIGVIHDTDLHDYPSYNGSYNHAASSTKAWLEQYPTIELVLDLHRDAADTAAGQLVTRCSIGGETAAQLMFVVGTDTRLEHPEWERNLSLALKLQVLLEQENPGICRNLNLTKNRYNQHLGKYALLIEVGAAGNTLDQARLAVRELGEAIIKLVGK